MKQKTPLKRRRKADPGVGYVVNVPLVVSDDSDGESSCDEEEESLIFPENYFTEPLEHFRLYPPKRNDKGKIISTKRGAVGERFFETDPPVVVPQKTQDLINIFHDTAFGENPDESHELIPEKLSMVIGLNRMRSLSTRNNNALTNSVVGSIKEPFPVEQIGFFWEGIWEERDPTSTSGWKAVSYDRVRKFYKVLKARDSVLAERFLKSIEKSKSHLVPYRGIREAIKTSKKTRMCVLEMRANDLQREVYLALSDSDVISWRGDKIGAFSFYDNMITTHRVTYQQPLEIGTVGYTIPKVDPATHHSNPMIALSVYLDLWVRHATAQFVKNGIYYPEPSMIVRILPTKDCVKESFVDRADPHYRAPKESTILIGNVLSNRAVDPETSMCFDAAGAFVMQMPARMQRDFEAHENQQGMVIRWTLDAIKKMRGINQSHYHANKWAKQILKAFPLASVTVKLYRENIIIKKGDVRNFLISALCRLFSHYDPVAFVEKVVMEQNAEQGFQELLVNTLGNYNPMRHPLTKGVLHKSTKDSGKNKVWKYLSELNSVADLKNFIDIMLASKSADTIEAAARVSNLKVVEILKERFCLNFSELSFGLLQDYFSRLLDKEAIEHKDFRMSPFQEKILMGNVLNEDGGLTRVSTRLLQASSYDQFGCGPMHYAALTGNVLLVRRLKRLAGGLLGYSKITVIANGEILSEFEIKKDELKALVLEEASREFIRAKLTNDQVVIILSEFEKTVSAENIQMYFDKYKRNEFLISITRLFTKHLAVGQILNRGFFRLPLPSKDQNSLYKAADFKVRIVKKPPYAAVLPLHLALQYCKDNGTHIELLKELTSAETYHCAARDGKKPYLMALTELNDQYSLEAARFFSGFNPIYTRLHQLLEAQPFFKKQHRVEFGSILCSVIWHVKDRATRLILVKFLLDQGADINQSGLVLAAIQDRVQGLNEDNIESISEELYQFPLLLAIATGDLPLVELLLQNGAKTRDVYCINGFPPIMCAMTNVNPELPMIHLLVRYDADVNDPELTEDTTPLCEAVDVLTTNCRDVVPLELSYPQGLDEAIIDQLELSTLSAPNAYTDNLPSSTFEYLLKAPGIDLEGEDGAFKTPLQIALGADDDDKVKKLLDAGAEKGSLDKDEREALAKILSDNTSSHAESGSEDDFGNDEELDTSSSSASSDSSSSFFLR